MRAIGIILAGGNNNRMRELSNKRAIAAMPIAGSYRSIDFALSNMASSHIQRVAVLTQYNARSLNEHLSSSKWWDFGRKQGGLFVFTPTITKENSLWYQGTADAIYQNLEFLKSSHEPYVVIASGDCVYKMDYNKVLEYHNPVVMLQGEFIFTFRLATKLKAAGIKVVAGRSERIVVERVNSEGIPVKKSEFHFAGFMEY